MDIITSIELTASMATPMAIIVAVIQLRVNQKQFQSSRDLEISLNMIESFRVRWETSWRVAFREIKSVFSENEEIKGEHLDDLLNMLNWADWLGNLIAREQLRNHQIIFDAVGTQLEDMLRVGRKKITDDCKKRGIDYWQGLVTVGTLLKVDWVNSLER